jgi:hypothetical protein
LNKNYDLNDIFTGSMCCGFVTIYIGESPGK